MGALEGGASDWLVAAGKPGCASFLRRTSYTLLTRAWVTENGWIRVSR